MKKRKSQKEFTSHASEAETDLKMMFFARRSGIIV